MAVIVLERGHVGRTGGRSSATHGGLVEDLLVRAYLAAAEDMLRAAGHEVIPISDGPYPDRQARAGRYGAAVYVAGHVNAGGYDKGAVFFDSRSTRGARLAELVALELEPVHPSTVHPIESSSSGWTRHAHYTIAGCYPTTATGICYEPGFIDCPEHADLWTRAGLICVGHALARGIIRYLEA